MRLRNQDNLFVVKYIAPTGVLTPLNFLTPFQIIPCILQIQQTTLLNRENVRKFAHFCLKSAKNGILEYYKYIICLSSYICMVIYSIDHITYLKLGNSPHQVKNLEN